MSSFGTDDWTLLDESGGTAVEFSSFIDIDIRNEGQALTYPIEEGSFANYNKVADPLEIKVTLSVEGSDADFETILAQLDDYKTGAVKLQVSTPARLYESMTLESYSYKRSHSAGAGLLTVELDLLEVREVETQSTTVTTKSSSASSSTVTSAKNASSESTQDTGKTQTKKRSSLKKIIG